MWTPGIITPSYQNRAKLSQQDAAGSSNWASERRRWQKWETGVFLKLLICWDFPARPSVGFMQQLVYSSRDHAGGHSCQLRTGTWCCSSHRFTTLDNRRCKNVSWSHVSQVLLQRSDTGVQGARKESDRTSLSFIREASSVLRLNGGESHIWFGANSIKSWIHAACVSGSGAGVWYYGLRSSRQYWSVWPIKSMLISTLWDEQRGDLLTVLQAKQTEFIDCIDCPHALGHERRRDPDHWLQMLIRSCEV